MLLPRRFAFEGRVVSLPRTVAGESCPVRISGSTLRVLLAGCGAVGARAARQLATVRGVDHVVIDDPRTDHVEAVVRSIGSVVSSLGERGWTHAEPDVVVLTTPVGHRLLAEQALALGAHVVSVSDAIEDCFDLLALHERAVSIDRTVLVGTGFSPGLTCVLARHAAAEFDSVDEIHVAKLGTGGPACARQHHDALRSDGQDWRDGAWVSQRGGSGRELCWFPDPIAGADCYRAALADPVLLHRHFPNATRITARVAATRRDRLTSRMPMLRPPHPEAGAGAIRVEVRGRKSGMADVVVFGAMDRPSVGAGAVLGGAVGALATGGVARAGAGGLAEMVEPLAFLAELARRGVKCARFEGAMGSA